MNENRNNIEIDLRRIFVVLLTRAWLIILVAVIFGAAAFSYAKFGMQPVYSASTQLYVNNNYQESSGYVSPGYSSSQLEAANRLADTYITILRSRDVIKAVQTQTGLEYKYSVAELRGMMSAAAVNETEIFQVTVTCNNYKDAATIANAVADILPVKSLDIVKGTTVTVVDRAQENPNKIGPSYPKYALLGAFIGGFLMAAILVVLELLDTTIHTEEYLDAAYKEYPLLAVIPGAEGSKNGYYKGYYRGYYAADKKPEDKKTAPENKKKSGGER